MACMMNASQMMRFVFTASMMSPPTNMAIVNPQNAGPNAHPMSVVRKSVEPTKLRLKLCAHRKGEGSYRAGPDS